MMKTSTTTTWEKKSEDITAQILAKRVQKEARLRHIVEQSAISFFIGGSLISTALRIGGLVVVGFLYFRSDALSTFGVWPFLVLGAFFEACRANRRLDAMLELESMFKETNKANKAEVATPRKPSD